jgi:hypothetical protein
VVADRGAVAGRGAADISAAVAEVELDQEHAGEHDRGEVRGEVRGELGADRNDRRGARG